MKTLIIAEAGVNHNADLGLAYQLIDAAVKCGADVVKFQTAIPKNVVTQNGKMANYQIKNIGIEESQLAMTSKIHLPIEKFDLIYDYCQEKNIEFATTAFDMTSLEYISKYRMPFYKIPSGEITNLPYIRRIGEFGQPVILSTGMSTLTEIEKALRILQKTGLSLENITVLHCTSTYPAPFNELNLKAIKTISEAFNVKVGYSDHSLGIEVPIAAVALGAQIIEKHLTLDSNLPGPDHKASIEPEQFKLMVSCIRNIEQALGTDVKEPSLSEKENINIARRSIVAKRAIEKGEFLSVENLICKRPGDGLSPMYWDEIIGKIATQNYDEDDFIIGPK